MSNIGYSCQYDQYVTMSIIVLQKWAPTSYKWGGTTPMKYRVITSGKPISFRPLEGVITSFITIVGAHLVGV